MTDGRRSSGHSGLIDPVIQWSVDEASPSGLAYFGGSLRVACLRGQRLYRILQSGPEAGRHGAALTCLGRD